MLTASPPRAARAVYELSEIALEAIRIALLAALLSAAGVSIAALCFIGNAMMRGL